MGRVGRAREADLAGQRQVGDSERDSGRRRQAGGPGKEGTMRETGGWREDGWAGLGTWPQGSGCGEGRHSANGGLLVPSRSHSRPCPPSQPPFILRDR